MNTLHRSLRLCRAEFVSWKKDYRVYLVFFLVFIFNYMYTKPLFDYAAQTSYPVTPWLLPLQMAGINNRMVVYGCAILLFTNILRNKPADQGILIRCGYRTVLLGKLLYVFAASLLYSVLFVLLTLLPYLNRIYLAADWGRVLWEWSLNAALSSGNNIPGMAYILGSGNGLTMTGWSFAHLWLSLSMVGLVMFLLNSGGGFLRGGIAAGIMLGMDRATTALVHRWLTFIPWVSPLTWSNAFLVDFGKRKIEIGIYPVPLWYADGAAIVLNIALVVLICVLARLSYRNGSRRQWLFLSQ